MARLILLLALGPLAYVAWQKLRQQPPEKQRKTLLRGAFFTLLGLVLLLVASGRVHWIVVAITAALPVLKGLLGLLLRALPFLQVWLKKHHIPADQPRPDQDRGLTEHEAWQLLGLKPGASREDIIRAHKRLIQKVHPDRGGNDYLASQLNTARDLLLKRHG
ncbi:J domain-containing protein [Porticoccus sp.]